MTDDEKRFPIKLKYIFYVEGIINFATVIICLFFPRFFLRQFTDGSIDPLATEISRWYGIILLVLTFILIGALQTEKFEFVQVVLIGYLIGDIAQIAATVNVALLFNKWSFGVLFAIILTAILIAFRILVFVKPQWLGLKNHKNKENKIEKNEEI